MNRIIYLSLCCWHGQRGKCSWTESCFHNDRWLSTVLIPLHIFISQLDETCQNHYYKNGIINVAEETSVFLSLKWPFKPLLQICEAVLHLCMKGKCFNTSKLTFFLQGIFEFWWIQLTNCSVWGRNEKPVFVYLCLKSRTHCLKNS